MTDGLGKELRRWRVPNIIALDLLGFRARLAQALCCVLHRLAVADKTQYRNIL